MALTEEIRSALNDMVERLEAPIIHGGSEEAVYRTYQITIGLDETCSHIYETFGAPRQLEAKSFWALTTYSAEYASSTKGYLFVPEGPYHCFLYGDGYAMVLAYKQGQFVFHDGKVSELIGQFPGIGAIEVRV